MCKYKYGENKCAHPKNIALECVGEDKCQYVEEVGSKKKEDTKTPDIDLETYEQEEAQEDTCPMTECGIYCKKYNRFYCAGRENCETKEEYMKHMKEFGGIDIEKGFQEE